MMYVRCRNWSEVRFDSNILRKVFEDIAVAIVLSLQQNVVASEQEEMRQAVVQNMQANGIVISVPDSDEEISIGSQVGWPSDAAMCARCRGVR